MKQTKENHFDRPICGRTFLLGTMAVVSTMAAPSLAIDPNYTLATSQVGLANESVTSMGYPGMHAGMTGGICVADFNNDTYPDLFIPSLGVTANKLYINNQDGTFTDQAAQWGVQSVHMGMGVAAGDLNNDGYPELFVVSFGAPGKGNAMPGQCLLYRNSGPDKYGNFHFEDIAEKAGVNTVMDMPGGMTPAFGDIDLDGDLDLFVATWMYDPTGNRLFENQGDMTFVDITAESLSAPDRQKITRGFTPHIVDITGDRYPEILMTADFTTSEILVNNGVNKAGRATFRTTTNKSNINADNNGMGAAVADFNADGLLDWFQTNIYMAEQNISNTLYMCTQIDKLGDPIFADEANLRGVENCQWGWGAVAADFDNDADQDIIATNGWMGWPNAPTRFWANDGAGFFTDRANQANLAFNINGRGLVALDHDKDGDLDLVFIDNQGPLRFYRNNLQTGKGAANYLRVDLDTSNHGCLAPDGFGTRIYATAGGQTQLHAVHNNASYLGHSEITTHIGLGKATVVDELRIEWADGSVTILNNLSVNQEMTIQAYHPADFNNDGQLDYFDASDMVAAFQAKHPSADFNNNGTIENADIFDFLASFQTGCP